MDALFTEDLRSDIAGHLGWRPTGTARPEPLGAVLGEGHRKEKGFCLMRTTIRLLQDHELAGETYNAGDFVEVDARVAGKLVDDLIAEEKTPEQAHEEEKKRIENERRRAAIAQRDNEMSTVRVIGDRADADPTAGYGKYGFGMFVKDVAAACKRNGAESDRLNRWHRRCLNSRGKTMFSGEATVEYDDSQGGYLIPPEYAARLHNVQIESSTVRPRATFFPMGTNRLAINAVVDEDHSSNLFGGITLYRPGEAEQKTTSKPNFRQVVLTLHKIVGLTTVSDEMIEDSPQSIETLITSLFGQAVAWQEDDDYFNGTGINQALGIINAGCLIAQAAEPAQAAATVVAANIVNMWSRMHPICHKNAVWHCNPSVLPQLYQMGLAVGTGGSVVFTPAGGLSASPYATLMGRPLIPTEHCQALGTQGDIVLCDWTQYAVGGKSSSGAPQVASSMHIYFDYDLTAFRFVLRYDGQPLWRVALTPQHGNTLSPFVALETRS